MEPLATKDDTDAADGGALAEAEELLAEAAAEEGAEAQAPNLDEGDEVAVEQPHDGEKESDTTAAAAAAAPPATAPAAPPPAVPTGPQKEPGSDEGEEAQSPAVSAVYIRTPHTAVYIRTKFSIF
jgi:hypothetical protein